MMMSVQRLTAGHKMATFIVLNDGGKLQMETYYVWV